MLGSVLLKSIRDLRRGFAWWALGLVGYAALIVSVYPTVRDNPELDELVESYPEALKAFIAFGGQFDFTSAAGYLGSELFSFMMPAIFLVASVGNGPARSRARRSAARSTSSRCRSRGPDRPREAGSDVRGDGRPRSRPVARPVVGARAFSMDVSVGHLAAATALLAVLAIAYGAIAFMLAGATGRKGLAVGVTVALAVAAYLVNSLAALVDALEPFQKVTPFYHYAASDPGLHQGPDLRHDLPARTGSHVGGGRAPLRAEGRRIVVVVTPLQPASGEHADVHRAPAGARRTRKGRSPATFREPSCCPRAAADDARAHESRPDVVGRSPRPPRRAATAGRRGRSARAPSRSRGRPSGRRAR